MRIVLVGDVMLGRLVNEALRQRPLEYPWGNTLSLFRSADIRMCNLECVISDIGKPWSAAPKEFHFRSDAKNVRVLSAGDINVVSSANNHSLDYGYEAAEDMLRLLDNANIKHTGLGNSLNEAERLALLNVHHKKIGVVAFTDNEPEWEATFNKPGVLFVPTELTDERSVRFLDLVKRSKESVDLLIVSAHWGPNWGYEPPEEHTRFAHALVEVGADIVFGHSGHVFRGIEIHRRRPILYCAGDFIDDYAIDPVERNDESFIFLLEGEGDKVDRIELYPTRIEKFQANLVKGLEIRLIGNKMRQLCAELGTRLVLKKSEGCFEAIVHN